MAVDIQAIVPTRPPVAALDMFNRVLLWAMREWLRAALAHEPVTTALREGLENAGMPELAGPVSRLMEEASTAWPEHLRLHPLGCGCPISQDEWLLLACITDASRGARASFDRRLSEMIGISGRDKIWRTACFVGMTTGWPDL